MKLMADEKIVLELTPSPNLLGYWIVTRCLLVAVLAAAVAGLTSSLVAYDLRAPIYGTGFVLASTAAGVIGFAVAALYASCLRRTYRYYVTDRRCAFHGGILVRIRHSVPFHKITDVEQRQNILHRLFGIWRVGVYTPGTSSAGPASGTRPELEFPGLTDPDRVADAISEALDRSKDPDE